MVPANSYNSVNVSTLCGAALSIPFADKYGRRRPLMLGCTATGFSMMMVAICLSFKENEAVGAQMSKAAVTFFFTVRAFERIPAHTWSADG